MVGGTRPATPPVKMVSLGDSLSAGSQDGSTVEDRQQHGWTQVLAQSAGVEWHPAYVDRQGTPFDVFQKGTLDTGHIASKSDHLQKWLAPLALYTYFIGTPLFVPPLWDWAGEGRRSQDSKTGPQTAFAVPGYESRHLVGIRKARDVAHEVHEGSMEMECLSSEMPLTRAILQNGGHCPQGSPVDRAVAADPDLILLWAGGNDSLHALFAGFVDDQSLTPLHDQRWTYHDTNPITGKKEIKTTKHVMPGFETSWLGQNGIVDRLTRETHAEVMLMTLPDVTVVPSMHKLGEKVGPIPFRVVLADGTDVTQKLENWTIPTGVAGPGKNGRQQFPPGTMAPLFTVLGAFLRSGEIADEAQLDRVMVQASQQGLFGEDDVMDLDELKQVQQRTDEFNDVLRRAAATNPRFHLVDAGAELRDIQQHGRHLLGGGSEDVVVTTTFTGVQDHGMDGIFSFDGVHPSDTGQAVIANYILQAIQKDLGSDPRFAAFAQAQPADEKAIFKNDPHRDGKQFSIILDRAHVQAIQKHSV